MCDYIKHNGFNKHIHLFKRLISYRFMIALLSRQCTRPVKMEFTVYNTLLISTNLHMTKIRKIKLLAYIIEARIATPTYLKNKCSIYCKCILVLP